MDFSVPGSDVWESTPTQEHFIESYFQHKEPLSRIVQKRKRKIVASDKTGENLQKSLKLESTKEPQVTDNQSQLSNRKTRKQKKKGRKVLDGKEREYTECPKRNTDSVIKKKKNKFVEGSQSKTISVKPVKKHVCKEKQETKSTQLEEDSHSNSYSSNIKSGKKFQESKSHISRHALNPKSSPLKPKKLKLNQKTKLKSSIHPECPTEKSMPSPTKKLKRKKTLRSDVYLESFSGDESDDEKIISEIQNSSIFKEIQKFMKETPSLQNLKDSDDTVAEESESCSDSDDIVAEESESHSDLDDTVAEESESHSDSDNTVAEESAPHSDSDNTVAEESESCSDSDTSKSNLIKGNIKRNVELPICQNRSTVKSITSPNEPSVTRNSSDFPISNVNNFPRAGKSCDFPRTVLKNSSDSTNMKDSLIKNREKLQGAKFRHLNEKLYTETGTNAFEYFQKNKEEFEEYHKGYGIQVSKWPMNPVDKILSDLRGIDEEAVIADMGCGDAKIARTLTNSTVHSFDIIALNDHVTACNISKVPLAKESVDIVVFCLSLMGTNLKEYLLEAHRILKMGGTLKIAEVESRIEDIDAFIRKLKVLGFSIKKKDLKHRMFVFLDLLKVKKKVKKDKIPSLALKPCLYKKR